MDKQGADGDRAREQNADRGLRGKFRARVQPPDEEDAEQERQILRDEAVAALA